MALDVEAGDLERGEDLVDGAGRGDHSRGADGPVVAAQAVGDRGVDRVEREHVQAGDRVGGGLETDKMRRVGVRLAEPDQPRVGVQLDDGAQRVGLVHADRIEQRRVDERDRGDAGAGDANPAGRHG